ncbi:SGNH/GDSL hydrolase family protein [Roseobacter sp. HKCCA0434]|uniref:SGNH/GDSL hydrolase family protein n=1 Tax=Roseobacter sp. HKCCA0434 TaxID=3079297 RepID=UPI002905D6DA|nr:SGNH/GDSL hydrolase family protein [Roseobacter sp. HKCCA0434]
MLLFDLTARTALLPILAAQAFQIRRRALKLPEADGARTGHAGTGRPLRVLIAGDSSAAGVGVDVQDKALSGQLVRALSGSYSIDWTLQAKSGDRTADTLAALEAMAPAQFDVVVLSVGTNDITHSVPLPLWRARYRRLRALLRTKFGARLIYVSGMPPMEDLPILPHPLRWTVARIARRFDSALQADLATEPDTRYVQLEIEAPEMLAEDGFHPGAPIYTAWADRIAGMISAEPTPLH